MLILNILGVVTVASNQVHTLNPTQINKKGSSANKEQHQNLTNFFNSRKNLKSLLDMVKVKPNKHMFGLRLIFHCLGISCLAGAVFLQVQVFMNVASQGFFMGVEKNPFILKAEIGLSIFCVVYLLYLSISKISSLLNSRN